LARFRRDTVELFNGLPLTGFLQHVRVDTLKLLHPFVLCVYAHVGPDVAERLLAQHRPTKSGRSMLVPVAPVAPGDVPAAVRSCSYSLLGPLKEDVAMPVKLSRKEFFDTTARTAVGVSVGAWAGSLVTAAAQEARQKPITAPAAVQGYPWPWPYVPLDPEEMRKRGHRDFYVGGCCYAAFNAIVSGLADAVGQPYTLVPPQMMYYGSGGGAGWGTLCGALNGAAAAISLVVDRTTASGVVGELFGWYTQVRLPTDKSNDYGVRQLFYVNKYDKALRQSVSSTPLCHGSVSKWCTESSFKEASPERKERCGRLTGDTAARAVELLNDYFSNRFRASFKPADAVAECMTCHDTAYGHVASSVKMDCRHCHNDTWDHLY
jgi:hypothetical protein